MSGNIFPERAQAARPVLQIPLADYVNLPSSQQGLPCGFFETQFFRCLEAYGTRLGRKYCDLEYRDYQECVSMDKQNKRRSAIRIERWKQWIRGERDTVYDDHIQMGQYRPHHFSNDLPF